MTFWPPGPPLLAKLTVTLSETKWISKSKSKLYLAEYIEGTRKLMKNLNNGPKVILGMGPLLSAERDRCSASWRSCWTCDNREETLFPESEAEEAHRIAVVGRERFNWREGRKKGRERSRVRRNKEEGGVGERCNSKIPFTILVVVEAITIH